MTSDLETQAMDASLDSRFSGRRNFLSSSPSRQDSFIAIAIFLLSFAYLIPFFRFTSLNADEGIVLQGAQRILEGQVLYRDFFSFYTPGSYYWTALLLRLFGDSILVPRFALLVYGGVLSATTYLLARRICGVWISLLATYLATLIALPFSFYVQHNWDSSVLSALAVLCLVRALEGHSPAKWFASGFLISLTALFEQSKGGGLFLGSALAVVLLWSMGSLRFTKASAIAAGAGLALPFTLTFAYFASDHALVTMIGDWLWPLHHYSVVNQVPYGYFPLSPGQAELVHSMAFIWRAFLWFSMSPLMLIPALPLFAVGFAFFQARRLRTDGRALRPHCVLVASILAGLWLGVLISRRDAGHVIYLLHLFILPLAWMIEGRTFSSSLLPRIRPVVVLWVLLSFSFLGFSMLSSVLNGHDVIETRRGMLKSKGTDTVFAYVQNHVPAGSKIFVYPYQPLYYYLTGSSNPTTYDYFQIGMHSGDQLNQAIGELERDHTKTVLFTTSFNEIVYIPWPNTPDSVVGAADPMADYVVRHYRPCASLQSSTNGDWVWLYMVRMGIECPGNLASYPSQTGGVR